MNQKKLPIVAIGLAIAAILAAACSAPAGTGGAQTTNQGNTNQRITIKTGSISNHIVATGQVTARATAQLAFKSSGVVKTVNVKIGDMVKAGQPLASLDTTDLELAAKQQYANFINVQASYSQTIAGPTAEALQAAQAGVLNAQEAYSQALKGGTTADYSSAYAAVNSAISALNGLNNPPTDNDVAAQKAALQNAQDTLQQAQAAYDTANRRNPGAIGASSESLALQTATNNYQAAKAAYDKLFQKPTDASIQSAKAQVASAQANLANLAPTAQKIAAAQQTLAQALSTLQALTPTNETVIMAQAKLDQAQVSWQQAQKAIADATIKAPYDGMIATVSVDVGDSVGSATAIELADFTVPQFQVSVDEADLGSVKVGEDALVQLQTYPNMQIPAKVEQVNTSGTTSGSIVTFLVYLSIGKVPTTTDGTTPNILLGMSGTSQIVIAKTDNAVLVPNNALVVDTQTKTYSVRRVAADGTIQQVPITIGFRGTDTVQALSGVNAGDVLAIPSAAGVSANGGFGAGGARPGGN